MATDSFLTSFVFKDGAITAALMVYGSPVKCEKPVEVYPHKMGGNCFYSKDCCFTIYASHNEGIIMNDKESPEGFVKEHIVEDDNKIYRFFAWLEKEEDTLSNSIKLEGKLPKGLKMYRLEAFSETEVFVFSGLNLMLFDVAISKA